MATPPPDATGAALTSCIVRGRRTELLGGGFARKRRSEGYARDEPFDDGAKFAEAETEVLFRVGPEDHAAVIVMEVRADDGGMDEADHVDHLSVERNPVALFCGRFWNPVPVERDAHAAVVPPDHEKLGAHHVTLYTANERSAGVHTQAHLDRRLRFSFFPCGFGDGVDGEIAW